jgi:hypothetical protein
MDRYHPSRERTLRERAAATDKISNKKSVPDSSSNLSLGRWLELLLIVAKAARSEPPGKTSFRCLLEENVPLL